MSFTSIFGNATGFSVRGDDILVNGQRPATIFNWDEDTNQWTEFASNATINLDTGVGSANYFQVTFDDAAVRNIRQNAHLIERVQATFNQDSTMSRTGVLVPFSPTSNDDHQQVIQNENNIATNSSRIDALENEVHNLEQDGSRIRGHAFHDVTIQDPSIDEVVGFSREATGAANFESFSLDQAVSPAGTANVTAGSHQLPAAISSVIDRYVQNVFAELTPLTSRWRSTAPGNITQEFQYTGQIPFPYATLRLLTDAQSFQVLLRVTSTAQGDIVHTLVDEWPVDDEITWDHIEVRWFRNEPGTLDSSLTLGPVPADTADGRQQLAVPMTAAQRTAFYAATEEFVSIHFVDQSGNARSINVDIPETTPTSFPNAPTWQDGFVYALVTLESTDDVELGLNSHYLINIGANPFQPVQEIPLSLWKANIWFGTEGLSGSTQFTLDTGLTFVNWTPYTSGGQTLWFLDDINITADGNFTAGDGVITQGDPAVATNVRPNNSQNYIG